MELGATVCRARRPECHRCPVRPECSTGRKRMADVVSGVPPGPD
jgi:adenine-specific DNA glycosylase